MEDKQGHKELRTSEFRRTALQYTLAGVILAAIPFAIIYLIITYFEDELEYLALVPVFSIIGLISCFGARLRWKEFEKSENEQNKRDSMEFFIIINYIALIINLLVSAIGVIIFLWVLSNPRLTGLNISH